MTGPGRDEPGEGPHGARPAEHVAQQPAPAAPPWPDDDSGLIDVSVAVSPGTPEWPGDTPYSCGWTWSMAAGSSVNVSSLTTSPHVGTHADAPLHVRDGWPGADALPLAAFLGPAVVVDASALVDDAPIGLAELDALAAAQGVALAGAARLLLRTGRTIAGGSFPGGWPVLSPECAVALIARGLRLLAVDCPSVDARDSKALEVHRALFGGGACVLENLDLRRVAPGPYALVALPVRLAGLDAAPVRAALRPLPAGG